MSCPGCVVCHVLARKRRHPAHIRQIADYRFLIASVHSGVWTSEKACEKTSQFLELFPLMLVGELFSIKPNTMQNIDAVLYKWITTANRKREELDLPLGLIEESVSRLRNKFGPEYLTELLVRDTRPVAIFDEESRLLRTWLLSGRVASHILQVLELAAYLRVFDQDPALPDKVAKLKKDRFWPIFFELAFAVRLKRACLNNQTVTLTPEAGNSVGDFTIKLGAVEIPCECSRLGSTPQVSEPRVLTEALFHTIQEKTKSIASPLCIKIRSKEFLTGHVYNRVLRLLRRAMHDARNAALPANYSDGDTQISVEILTAQSEAADYGATGDWDAGMRLHSVPAQDRDEVNARFDQGERFRKFEHVRVFLKFGKATEDIDHYMRLTTKLRKKLKQTKLSDRHLGKILFIEVPFDLRTVNDDKLRRAVRAAMHSKSTLAVVLANRERNPQRRYHYSQSATFSEVELRSGRAEINELVSLLNRSFQSELKRDPVTGEPYIRSWAEAQARQDGTRADD